MAALRLSLTICNCEVFNPAESLSAFIFAACLSIVQDAFLTVTCSVLVLIVTIRGGEGAILSARS